MEICWVVSAVQCYRSSWVDLFDTYHALVLVLRLTENGDSFIHTFFSKRYIMVFCDIRCQNTRPLRILRYPSLQHQRAYDYKKPLICQGWTPTCSGRWLRQARNDAGRSRRTGEELSTLISRSNLDLMLAYIHQSVSCIPQSPRGR